MIPKKLLNGQKRTETDRNRQKQTETDTNGQNGYKQTETDRNGQKRKQSLSCYGSPRRLGAATAGVLMIGRVKNYYCSKNHLSFLLLHMEAV